MQILLNEQESQEWLARRKEPMRVSLPTDDTISRTVKVDRSRTAQEALKATGRNLYVNDDVVELMPQGEGDEVEVNLFNVGRYITDDELNKEFYLRGLKPVDPFALAALNEAYPAFADEKPNATHWKDAQGNWCYAIFGRWRGERRVNVNRNAGDWNDNYWFAGVRK
jgi:hypothetical protein